MKTNLVFGAAALALAVAGCSRGDGGNNQAAANNSLPTPTARPNSTATSNPAGLRVDAQQMANNCISPEDQRRPLAEISMEQRRQVVACINAQAARQISGQLPRQIDAATRLDRITAEGTLLTYHYTITQPLSQLPSNLAQQLETMTQRTVCAQPQMRQTLELGGSYGYRWVDTGGALVAEARVEAC